MDNWPRCTKRTLCGQVVRRQVLVFEPMSLDELRSLIIRTESQLWVGRQQQHLIRVLLAVAEAIDGGCEKQSNSGSLVG